MSLRNFVEPTQIWGLSGISEGVCTFQCVYGFVGDLSSVHLYVRALSSIRPALRYLQQNIKHLHQQN